MGSVSPNTPSSSIYVNAIVTGLYTYTNLSGRLSINYVWKKIFDHAWGCEETADMSTQVVNKDTVQSGFNFGIGASGAEAKVSAQITVERSESLTINRKKESRPCTKYRYIQYQEHGGVSGILNYTTSGATFPFKWLNGSGNRTINKSAPTIRTEGSWRWKECNPGRGTGGAFY